MIFIKNSHHFYQKGRILNKIIKKITSFPKKERTNSRFILLSLFVLHFTINLNAQISCDNSCTSSGPNLLNNGDFEQGNIGFTSPYQYYNQNPMPGGQYIVSNNPSSIHFAYAGADHTSGNGKMMIINGTNPGTFYNQNISVQQNTCYRITVWLNNIVSSQYPNLAEAQIRYNLNGTTYSSTTASFSPDQWIKMEIVWNSGNNITLNLQLEDIQTNQNGNDFAIDDISVFEMSCNANSSQCRQDCPNTGGNLIVNSDFSNSNLGNFVTPNYIYFTPNPIIPPSINPMNDGYYSISSDPSNLHSNWIGKDHTSGNGPMLVVNGLTSGVFYTQTVSVKRYTCYRITAWLMNVVNNMGVTEPKIRLKLNSSNGPSINLPENPNQWVKLEIIWNSENNTTLNLSLDDIQSLNNGNDFAVDDISVFEMGCEAKPCNSTCFSNGSNLVINGDFEQGNVSFNDFNYIPFNGIPNMPENYYAVVSNASSVHNSFIGTDNTAGVNNVLMMVVNGNMAASNFYGQKIPVKNYSCYRITAYVRNVANNVASAANPTITFTLNGNASNVFSTPPQDGIWHRLQTYWFSGSSTNLDLVLNHLSVAGNGNDFAVDDISVVELMCGGISDGDDIPKDDGDIEIGDDFPDPGIAGIGPQIKVYPNPSSSTMNLTLDANIINVYTITIYDKLGQQVIKEVKSTNDGKISSQIDISSLKQGIYWLVIDDGEKKYTKIISRQ
ncbi:MAG: T9SS type A sorting domain-containing protein [Bacteroidetes bacterium]|nr:T9SS type A sorting domain-containing protein [Bacteroidota bacterium]